MPRVEIESANSGKYQAPHERQNGPWEDWELEDAGRHLEHAEKIRANPKMAEALAKHHEKKAKEHSKLAHHARHLRKSGHVSDTALKKAADKRG
jgi:hypothetical protein